MDDSFHFKEFSVNQANCAMKVNTDGVLLAAMAEVENPQSILDIGTGTGVIALMLAQRFSLAMIDAIEIEPSAAQTARANFEQSKYAQRISGYEHSFQDFFELHPQKKYDLIISNPPFFFNSLPNLNTAKTQARHVTDGFFQSLFSGAFHHLNTFGSLQIIVPLKNRAELIVLAASNGLYVRTEILIKSFPNSLAHRVILNFVKDKMECTLKDFTIYQSQKVYSDEYAKLLQPFFTIF